jgi:hypothetical protein
LEKAEKEPIVFRIGFLPRHKHHPRARQDAANHNKASMICQAGKIPEKPAKDGAAKKADYAGLLAAILRGFTCPLQTER